MENNLKEKHDVTSFSSPDLQVQIRKWFNDMSSPYHEKPDQWIQFLLRCLPFEDRKIFALQIEEQWINWMLDPSRSAILKKIVREPVGELVRLSQIPLNNTRKIYYVMEVCFSLAPNATIQNIGDDIIILKIQDRVQSDEKWNQQDIDSIKNEMEKLTSSDAELDIYREEYMIRSTKPCDYHEMIAIRTFASSSFIYVCFQNIVNTSSNRIACDGDDCEFDEV